MEMQNALQIGTKLQNGQYTIDNVLGQGATGITYLASMQQNLAGNLGTFNAKVQVAIKEFFLKEESQRNYDTKNVVVPGASHTEKVARFKESFIREASRLSSLSHPNIVHVLSIFEENDTVYYVMQYVKGGSLKDVLTDFGHISERVTLKYAIQISSALCYMHNEKKMCHYDLKPGNIMLSSDNNAMLIDFGISKNYDNNGLETSTTPPGLTKGFAPLEQYSSISSFSPKIDVYSLGATIYNALTGEVPPEPTVSINKPFAPCPEGVSQTMWDIVRSAMSIAPENRPSMKELHDRMEKLYCMDMEPDPKGVTGDNPKPGDDTPNGGDTVYEEEIPNSEDIVNGEEKKEPDTDINQEDIIEKKPHNGVLYIILCIALFAAVGVGTYFLVNHFTKPSADAADSTQTEVIDDMPEIPITDENGQQTMTFKGRLENGLPSGKGILTYIIDDEKEHYEGNFVNGKCEDKAGALFYRNGDVYRGIFIGGHLTTGTYYVKGNGEYFEGKFQNDRPFDGYWFDLHNNVIAHVKNGVEQQN